MIVEVACTILFIALWFIVIWGERRERDVYKYKELLARKYRAQKYLYEMRNDDYIAHCLIHMPRYQDRTKHPPDQRWLHTSEAALLYLLHKLNVRPPL